MLENINKNNILALWEAVDYAGKNKLSLAEAIIYQDNYNNKFINIFFAELSKEISLNNYRIIFQKYIIYIDIIKNLFSDRFEFGGGREFRFYHSLYVANLCNKICDDLKLSEEDKEIVILSAIFHDVGKSIEAFKYVDERGFDKYEIIYNTGRHEDIGAEITRGILENRSLESNKIEKILEAISYKNSNSIYENILHDADNIAEIGLMGIWRFFYFKSCENKEVGGLYKFWFNKIRAIKLKDLESSKFEIAKELMGERVEIMDLVLAELES